jgi:hypothetical protein
MRDTFFHTSVRLHGTIDRSWLRYTYVYADLRKMGIKTRLFIAFCIGIVLLGGALALLANMRLRQPTYAAHNLPDDLSVVGPPSLPASTVDAIFARLGSPMVGTGALVEQTSGQVNIDDAFALAVWWTETNDGAAGVGLADRNPGSVRGSIGYPSAYDGYTIYPSYADAVVYWFHMLQNIYIDRGLTTVYAISHPYVGTSTSYLWAGKVVALMLRYRGEAPPPTPSPTVSPTAPARNMHIARPVNTGVTSTTAQSSASFVSGLQAALYTAPATQQEQQQNAPLSTTATWLIAACALLLALATALAAHLFLTPLPASKRSAIFDNQPLRASFAAPNTDALYAPLAFQSPIFHLPSRPLYEPQTDDLVGTRFIASDSFASNSIVPTPAASTPAAFLPAASKIRRTQLRPAPPNADEPQKVPVPAGGRPTGLLARYGNTSNS